MVGTVHAMMVVKDLMHSLFPLEAHYVQRLDACVRAHDSFGVEAFNVNSFGEDLELHCAGRGEAIWCEAVRNLDDSSERGIVDAELFSAV
jgi:hypothetical protein